MILSSCHSTSNYFLPSFYVRPLINFHVFLYSMSQSTNSNSPYCVIINNLKDGHLWTYYTIFFLVKVHSQQTCLETQQDVKLHITNIYLYSMYQMHSDWVLFYEWKNQIMKTISNFSTKSIVVFVHSMLFKSSQIERSRIETAWIMISMTFFHLFNIKMQYEQKLSIFSEEPLILFSFRVIVWNKGEILSCHFEPSKT